MHHARRFIFLAFIFTTFFMGTAFVANADADIVEGYLYCNYVEAQGTSDSPYVTLYSYNYDSGEGFYTIIDVVAGSWGVGYFFPEAPQGTLFRVEAWGTVAPYSDFNDPNFWDGGEFFAADVLCDSTAVLAPLPEVPSPETPGDNTAVPAAPIALSCKNGLPSDSVVYDVPLGAPAYYAADLQTATNFNLPAGTWKISEFSGDFAKVWIACEADPIWIPSSAVGGAIG